MSQFDAVSTNSNDRQPFIGEPAVADLAQGLESDFCVSSAVLENTTSTCILAGYCRLERFESGEIRVDPQLQAFDAGLRRASAIRAATGQLPPISVGFDHKGSFQGQFLASGLSSKQRRDPRVLSLHPDIVKLFDQSAVRNSISLEHIVVIPEESVRTRMINTVQKMNLPPPLQEKFIVPADQRPARNGATCAIDSPSNEGLNERPKATCAALTAEDYRYAVRQAQSKQLDITLEVFFEIRPWSAMNTYIRGIQLAQAIGYRGGIRLHFVDASGGVTSAKVAHLT